jgi:ABC-type methionine transport system permease subunit
MKQLGALAAIARARGVSAVCGGVRWCGFGGLGTLKGERGFGHFECEISVCYCINTSKVKIEVGGLKLT